MCSTRKPLNTNVQTLISLIILVCFLTSNFSSAIAQVKSKIDLDPSIFLTVDPEKYTLPADELNQEEISEIKKFLEKPTQTTLEIMFLLKNLHYRVQMEEERQGVEAIGKILSKRKDSENIEFEVENVGKAEPFVINTERGPLFLTKVRHNGLKMSILFIDKNQIDLQLLEESEKLLKTGKINSDKTLEGLSAGQIKAELKHRKFILNHMRTLYARMLMSEWSPELSYTPLSEIIEKSSQHKKLRITPDQLQERVEKVLKAPISSLKKENWFKRLTAKAYATWIDLAKEQQDIKSIKNGNEELMVVLYDGETGQIKNTETIKRQTRFSYLYWRDYWKMVWEKPAYNETLWKNEKGLGKARVLLTGDYLMGLTFGVALGSLSFLTALTFPNSLPDGLSPSDVGKISFGWSLFFGVFSKTWQNFVYRGNDFVRFVKNWSTGLGQSYHFNLVSEESLSLINNGRFDPNAAKIHTDILINQSIKTTSKTSLQETPRFRAKTGEAEGTLKIKDYKITLPWKNNTKFIKLEVVENTIDPLKVFRWVRNQFSITEYSPKEWEQRIIMRFRKDIKITFPWLIPFDRETSIPRKNFEGQIPQLITTPVGLLSRFGYTVWGLPLGHILYAILGPLGEIKQIRYKAIYANEIAKKYGEDHALTRRMRRIVEHEVQSWNSLKILNIPGSQFIGYYAKTIPKRVWEASKDITHFVARKTSYATYTGYTNLRSKLTCSRLFKSK